MAIPVRSSSMDSSSITAPAIVTITCLTTGLTTDAQARDWYVSISRGKGKKGTKEKPAKELGNIIKKLQPGDVIHIAAGVYLGRGDSGTHVITVPVSIIGVSSQVAKVRVTQIRCSMRVVL